MYTERSRFYFIAFLNTYYSVKHVDSCLMYCSILYMVCLTANAYELIFIPISMYSYSGKKECGNRKLDLNTLFYISFIYWKYKYFNLQSHTHLFRNMSHWIQLDLLVSIPVWACTITFTYLISLCLKLLWSWREVMGWPLWSHDGHSVHHVVISEFIPESKSSEHMSLLLCSPCFFPSSQFQVNLMNAIRLSYVWTV